jgi:mannose-6-phosphate isomerase-like protein (cupin superfamily)
MSSLLVDRCVFPWDEARRVAHATGFRMPFVDGECGARQVCVHISIINPGEMIHPPHAHAGEEVMFVLEGTGEVILGEETRHVGPMTALFYPEHVLHGLRNIGSSPMAYLVMRVR